MGKKPLCIAVTGLNATDNPAPGVGVIRALRLNAAPGERFVGLAYDALDPGIYASLMSSCCPTLRRECRPSYRAWSTFRSASESMS
jgi:hypothetical protein